MQNVLIDEFSLQRVHSNNLDLLASYNEQDIRHNIICLMKLKKYVFVNDKILIKCLYT